MNLWRWPDGVTGAHFWQKQIPAYAPEWIKRWDYPDAGSWRVDTTTSSPTVSRRWPGWPTTRRSISTRGRRRSDDYRNPDYALIDIDPGKKTTWDDVVTLARLYRAALQHLNVTACPRSQASAASRSGSRSSAAATRTRDERLGRGAVAGGRRDRAQARLWDWAKSSRGGLARLDFTQNAVNKTLVAPYAVRPVGDAAVSAPISWDEIDDEQLRPGRWNIETIVPRVAKLGDLFEAALTFEQELPQIG